MVSKVVVVALVAILAVPILMGYAMNLSEVTETEYNAEGDSVNVTPLLKNATMYTDTYADTYAINTNFSFYNQLIMPSYFTTSGASSSMPIDSIEFYAGDYYQDPFKYGNYDYFFFKSNGDGAGTIAFNLIKAADNTIFATYDNICTWYWDLETRYMYFTIYNADKTDIADTYSWIVNDTDYWGFMFTVSADYSSTGYCERLHHINGASTYVDFSKGYRFPHPVKWVDINLPNASKSILMSIDISSIQATGYYIHITPDATGNLDLLLTKSTVNGVSSWSLVNDYNGDIIANKLYFDTSKNDNTYQLFISVENITTNTWQYHVEFRYVGSWPSLIGVANYYKNYTYDLTVNSVSDLSISKIQIGGNNAIYDTPVLRVDAAIYPGFAIDVIQDQTYSPAEFKENPTTTLDVVVPGRSLQFGGNTYAVDSSGNITLGTHKVSVYKIKLESLPSDAGYENRINGIVVSNTVNPSNIVFDGLWRVSVSTSANAQVTYTKTEWTPGQFAWDGLDQNFLMIGLLAALGVFIALGIAYRRVKSALFALLVVCGGAAVLFFTML